MKACRFPAAAILSRGFGATVVLLLLAGVGLPSPAMSEEDPASLIEFRIKDQFDKLHTSGYYRNAVTVLVSGDRKGNEFMAGWLPVLEDSLAAPIKSYRVKLIPHAQLKGAPFFVKGAIRESFLSEGKGWILMDWSGDFQKSYDFEKDHCSILVFDIAGLLKAKWAVAEFDEELLNDILAVTRGLAD